MNILLVEDNTDLRETVVELLSDQSMNVWEAGSGDAAIKVLSHAVPDLIILDQHLPDMLGTDVLAAFKVHPVAKHAPIIFLSGKGDQKTITTALDEGADDYITKPFDGRILLSRVNAVLRRAYPNSKTKRFIYFDNIILDLREQQVRVGDERLEFTNTEFNIFKTLLADKGDIVSRHEIIQKVLGGVNLTSRTVDVHVCSLRRKLKSIGKNIETVRGRGYRLTQELKAS